MPTPETNHNQEITITKMVRNRLPFLLDTETNNLLISQFIFEICNELEQCLKKATSENDIEGKIGDEQYYKMTEKMLIADLVAVQILIITALANIAGNVDTNNNSVGPQSTFISKAKAGSAEIEYKEFDISKSAILAIKPEVLISGYKKSAISRGAKIGCYFDLTDENVISWLNGAYTIKPFVVVENCNCK